MENATFELDIVGCAGFMFTKQNERQMAIPWEGGGRVQGAEEKGNSPCITYNQIFSC